MPRRYDRLIRFYDSWFDDFADQEKELSANEQLEIIRAIRDCQVEMSTEPIDNLPLNIRRSLSMSTLREQITRIIDKTSRMQQRGRLGGQIAAARTPEERREKLEKALNETPKNDGVQRNTAGMVTTLQQYGLYEEEITEILRMSNFGQIGTPAWKIIFSAKDKQHKREYVLKSMGLPIQQQLF